MACAFRNPELLIEDAPCIESKNAEILLEIHGPTLKGEAQRLLFMLEIEGDQGFRRLELRNGVRPTRKMRNL